MAISETNKVCVMLVCMQQWKRWLTTGGGAWMHVPVTGGKFSQKFLGTTVLIMHKINSLKCSNNVVMICDCIKGNIL